MLRAGNYALLRRALPFPPEDLERYVEAMRHPGALPAMVHYYRALLRYPRPRVRRIMAPTLLIWGERDPALVPQLAGGLERGVPNLRVECIPEATHWVQHDVPDRVNELLIRFLA
jgi:pimeloyl-ACP methyl ester carboxylesterase